MIKGVHTMFYSDQPEELRAFLKDVLNLPSADIGQGWIVFKTPEGDMGVHPTEHAEGSTPSGTHEISFFCDDIQATVAAMKAKNVEFKGEIEDHGYGLVTHFKVPGNFWIMLYQPKYEKNWDK